jgi:tyrosyl-tRNA synthetase
MKDFSFLEFIRDVGKHITVNYMMAKDSVKKRIGEESKQGMSFTEFSYQLVQGYDFLYLYKNRNCRLQMGGSDQWGNITTGTELIRRKEGGEAFALTCPLITKSDGGKFGKTEQGNVWLDPDRTSPYEFYQFWLNVSDEDAEQFIRKFTLLKREEISALIEEHKKTAHLRILQKRMAEEVTRTVHSEKDLEQAVEASQILFGKGTFKSLNKLDEKTLLQIFDGVPLYTIEKNKINNNINISGLLVDITGIFSSKGELRRMVEGGGLSINKEKITDIEHIISDRNLISNKYLLIQKGKKNYYLITAK